jgi:hypothetical protein
MKNSYYRYFVVDKLIQVCYSRMYTYIYVGVAYISSHQVINFVYCLILSYITLPPVIQLLIASLIAQLIKEFLNIFYFNIKHLAKIFV